MPAQGSLVLVEELPALFSGPRSSGHLDLDDAVVMLQTASARSTLRGAGFVAGATVKCAPRVSSDDPSPAFSMLALEFDAEEGVDRFVSAFPPTRVNEEQVSFAIPGLDVLQAIYWHVEGYGRQVLVTFRAGRFYAQMWARAAEHRRVEDAVARVALQQSALMHAAPEIEPRQEHEPQPDELVLEVLPRPLVLQPEGGGLDGGSLDAVTAASLIGSASPSAMMAFQRGFARRFSDASESTWAIVALIEFASGLDTEEVVREAHVVARSETVVSTAEVVASKQLPAALVHRSRTPNFGTTTTIVTASGKHIVAVRVRDLDHDPTRRAHRIAQQQLTRLQEVGRR